MRPRNGSNSNSSLITINSHTMVFSSNTPKPRHKPKLRLKHKPRLKPRHKLPLPPPLQQLHSNNITTASL